MEGVLKDLVKEEVKSQFEKFKEEQVPKTSGPVGASGTKRHGNVASRLNHLTKPS